MVVDASVWVSALVASDAYHLPSRRWLGEKLAAHEQVIVPTLLLPEVAGAVARRTGIQELGSQAVAEIFGMPGLRLVGLDRELAESAAHTATRLRLRGADAVYVTVARYLNVPLVTWDREFQERSGGFVQVLSP